MTMKLAYVSVQGRGATDACLAAAAARLAGAGFRLTGTVEAPGKGEKAHPCDMDLQVLPDGPAFRISQNLGAGSRGCRLDGSQVEEAIRHVAARLAGADLLIVNKFGKLESEGRGYVPLIAEAIARDMAVLVGVNALNLEGFLAFAEGSAQALPADPGAILDWAKGRT